MPPPQADGASRCSRSACRCAPQVRHLDQRRPAPGAVYAHDLYNNLRTLDTAGCQRILVQDVPDGERWEAVRDRLMRAATSSPRATTAPARWPCCLKLPLQVHAPAIHRSVPARAVRRLVREFGSPLLILDCERVRVQFAQAAAARCRTSTCTMRSSPCRTPPWCAR